MAAYCRYDLVPQLYIPLQAFGYQDPLGLLISSCARIGFLPKHSGSPKTSPQCNDTLALPASQAAAFSNPQ